MRAFWFHHAASEADYTALCAYVSQRIWGKLKPFLNGTGMAVLDGDNLAAGVIFYDYDPDAGVIQISAAAETPRWLTRSVLFDLFSYPFDQLKCQAVVMRVDPANDRLRRILTAYGFSRHEIPRLRGRDKSECLYILAEEDWRANGFHKE